MIVIVLLFLISASQDLCPRLSFVPFLDVRVGIQFFGEELHKFFKLNLGTKCMGNRRTKDQINSRSKMQMQANACVLFTEKSFFYRMNNINSKYAQYA